jgi:hypothetical protein
VNSSAALVNIRNGPQGLYHLAPQAVNSSFALFQPDVPGEYLFQMVAYDGCDHATGRISLTASCARAFTPDAGAPQVVELGNTLVALTQPAAVAPLQPLTVYVNGSLRNGSGSVVPANPWLQVHWTLDKVTSFAVAGVPGSIDGALAATAGAACIDSPMTLVNESLRCLPSTAQLRNAASLQNAYFVPDVLGVYALTLHVTDNCTTWTASTTVEARCNAPPVANSGGDKIAYRGAHNAFLPVVLDGSHSYDPDPVDTLLQFQWSLVQAPPSSILDSGSISSAVSSAASGNPGVAVFTPDVPGVFLFRLEVFDGCSSGYDLVEVDVAACNGAPVAAANVGSVSQAFDAVLGAFRGVILDGTYSSDPDGTDDIVSYEWNLLSQTSSLDASAVIFYDAANASQFFTPVTPLPGLDTHSPMAAAITMFTPTASYRLPASSPDFGGAAVTSSYLLQLTVSDTCTTDSVHVTINATCPHTPFVTALPGPTIVWNARAGSRFAYPANQTAWTNTSEADRCMDSTGNDRGCGTVLTFNGSSHHPSANARASWSWASVPSSSPLALAIVAQGQAAGFANASAPVTWLTLDQSHYNNSNPFATASLGVSIAGVYSAAFDVQEDCAAMAAATTATLACNSPPNSTVAAPRQIVYTQGNQWGTVQLTGAGSPASTNTDLLEATRDASTTRYDWSVAFIETAAPSSIVAGVRGGPGVSTYDLAGNEITSNGGLQEMFVTSTMYNGDLVTAANLLYNVSGVDGYPDGLLAADAICRYHASASFLPYPSDFKAHICGGHAISAASRVSQAGPVYSTGTIRGGFTAPNLIGGSFKVACGSECSTTLASGLNWLSAPTFDEHGRATGNVYVYNGCDPAGNIVNTGSPQPLCANWTSASNSLSSNVGSGWLTTTQRYNGQPRTCDIPSALTCMRSAKRSPAALGYPIGSYRSFSPSFTPTKVGLYNISFVSLMRKCCSDRTKFH